MTPARWFLAALALYFAAQAALRISLGGALEVDEAEMLVLAQDWRWGYGPQLPLYNWLQVGSFAIFGPTTAALAILKNLVLWAAYAGLFIGLRQVASDRRAMLGTLSLVLLPNVMWEFQRASTHSIALLAAITWTLAAVLAVLNRGRLADYIWLGVALGIGGLAKPNFWLLPLALLLAALITKTPQRLRAGPMALAGLVMAALVAMPLVWVLQNPDLAFASTAKLYRSDSGYPDWLEGLGEGLGGLLAGMVLVLIAAAILRYVRRRQPSAPDWPAQLLLRAAGIATVLTLAAIAVAGASQVQSRWLLPIMLLASPGVILAAAPAPSLRAARVFMAVALALALVTLSGMADLRLRGKATGSIDFAPLAGLAGGLRPTAVFANYHIGGNLRLLRPDLRILAPQRAIDPLPTGPVLILTSGDVIPDPATAFAERGLPLADRAVLGGGPMTLAFGGAQGEVFTLNYLALGAAQN